MNKGDQPTITTTQVVVCRPTFIMDQLAKNVCGLNVETQKNTCHNEIGLYAKDIVINLSSIAKTVERPMSST